VCSVTIDYNPTFINKITLLSIMIITCWQLRSQIDDCGPYSYTVFTYHETIDLKRNWRAEHEYMNTPNYCPGYASVQHFQLLSTHIVCSYRTLSFSYTCYRSDVFLSRYTWPLQSKLQSFVVPTRTQPCQSVMTHLFVWAILQNRLNFYTKNVFKMENWRLIGCIA
jgi:hypothetical protein